MVLSLYEAMAPKALGAMTCLHGGPNVELRTVSGGLSIDRQQYNDWFDWGTGYVSQVSMGCWLRSPSRMYHNDSDEPYKLTGLAWVHGLKASFDWQMYWAMMLKVTGRGTGGNVFGYTPDAPTGTHISGDLFPYGVGKGQHLVP